MTMFEIEIFHTKNVNVYTDFAHKIGFSAGLFNEDVVLYNLYILFSFTEQNQRIHISSTSEASSQ